MPQRTVDPVIVPFTALVPAGTLVAAPVTFNPPLPVGTLEVIELQIPPGHVGATGIRFTLNDQQVLPWSNTVAWINGDNLDTSFPLDVEVSNRFRVVAYNVGNYDHSFYLRFRVRQLPTSSGMPSLTLLPSSQLSQSA